MIRLKIGEMIDFKLSFIGLEVKFKFF